MGKPKTKIHHKLGPFIWVQPSKAQINSHPSLGHSITCSSPLQVTTTEEMEIREAIAGGPRSWSRLPTFHSASPRRAAPFGVECTQPQRLGVSVEPAAAAFIEAWRASSAGSGLWGRARLRISSSTSSPRSSHSRRAVLRIRTRRRWTTRLRWKLTATALRKVRSAWGSPERCRRKPPLPEPRPGLEGALM